MARVLWRPLAALLRLTFRRAPRGRTRGPPARTLTSRGAHAPLKGVLVVALEQAVAAPFCTAQLAAAGARVIKIERPQGGDFARHYDTFADGLSSYFVWLNQGWRLRPTAVPPNVTEQARSPCAWT